MITLKNATLLHFHPAEVESGMDVVINGTEIVATGRGAATGVRAAESITCAGRIVMPGMVCAHGHVYSLLSRGILAAIPESQDFVSILANLWWRLDRAIDQGILRSSAITAAIEAIRVGCTAIVDHHSSPSFISGSLDVIRSGFEKVGIRGVLCYETTERNGPGGRDEGIAENRRFAGEAEKARENGEERLVEAMIGGHAPFTLSDNALAALGDLVRESGRGFHVHVSEDSFEPSYSHSEYRLDPLARLDRFGLLSDKSVVAHGLYLNRAELELLNHRDSFLVHNPRSNMNNHVGYAAGLGHAKNVALGTDGIGTDMLRELAFAYFKHRDAGGVLAPTDFTRFLQGGNEILSRCFGENFGRVRKGYKADLVILDYAPPTPLESSNISGHALFGMTSGNVDTVIVNGKVVMRERAFDGDTTAIYEESREAARTLWRKMEYM